MPALAGDPCALGTTLCLPPSETHYCRCALSLCVFVFKILAFKVGVLTAGNAGSDRPTLGDRRPHPGKTRGLHVHLDTPGPSVSRPRRIKWCISQMCVSAPHPRGLGQPLLNPTTHRCTVKPEGGLSVGGPQTCNTQASGVSLTQPSDVLRFQKRRKPQHL